MSERWTHQCWQTANGRVIPITELADGHLINIVRHIKFWNKYRCGMYSPAVIGLIWTECLHRNIDPVPLTPKLRAMYDE
jgi:hypothetical protein